MNAAHWWEFVQWARNYHRNGLKFILTCLGSRALCSLFVEYSKWTKQWISILTKSENLNILRFEDLTYQKPIFQPCWEVSGGWARRFVMFHGISSPLQTTSRLQVFDITFLLWFVSLLAQCRVVSCRDVSWAEVADDTGLTFTQLANTLYESGSRVVGTHQPALCRCRRRSPVLTHSISVKSTVTT